jgi:putative oxidoreductase
MTVVRRLARPLLAAAFIDTGLDCLRHPGPHVDAARPLINRAAGPLGLPDDPETAVRANGAAMAVAGALFGLGRLPRSSAAVMAATLGSTICTTHAFWREDDPERRHTLRRQFVQHVALIGAALISAVDTQGRPDLTWRSRRAAAAIERKTAVARRRGRRELGRARAAAHLPSTTS